MKIVVLRCNPEQVMECNSIGIFPRILNDIGGAYNGWYQVSEVQEKIERLRKWLTDYPMLEHRFF